VHGFGQFLGAEVAATALGEPVENLELADAEAVPLAHLALEGCAGRRVAGRDGPPGRCVVAAIRIIPRGEQVTRGGRRFDVPGAITITGAMLLLVYTVVAAQQAGWGSVRTIGSFAAVAVALAGFVVIERRSADPLVPLGIFRSGALTRANIGAMTLFGSYVSFQFLVTQYLQSLAGWSALSTALAFLPAGVVVATRMSAFIDRFGPARVTVLAFISLVAGYLVFLRVGARRHHRDLRHRGADRAQRAAAGPATGRRRGDRDGPGSRPGRPHVAWEACE
jgi:putative effector of murein hydrolase LrgA (UPF0299 family)